MFLSQFDSVRPLDVTTVSNEFVTHKITTHERERMFLNDMWLFLSLQYYTYK